MYEKSLSIESAVYVKKEKRRTEENGKLRSRDLISASEHYYGT